MFQRALFMDILGHNRINVAMDIYAHVMPNMICDAAEVMNAVIAGEK
jgi:hypothetical protein